MYEALQPTPNIVVIDDNLELLTPITMLLRHISAQVATFDGGWKAVTYLSESTPDLIILDLMLPDVDGLEWLRQIRKQVHFNGIPILILSAKADPDTIRQGLENGGDGYVTKPYIANSLITHVRILLKQGRETCYIPPAP